jgi:hypothetical protein
VEHDNLLEGLERLAAKGTSGFAAARGVRLPQLVIVVHAKEVFRNIQDMIVSEFLV